MNSFFSTNFFHTQKIKIESLITYLKKLKFYNLNQFIVGWFTTLLASNYLVEDARFNMSYHIFENARLNFKYMFVCLLLIGPFRKEAFPCAYKWHHISWLING
jgi:hypothetical protein